MLVLLLPKKKHIMVKMSDYLEVESEMQLVLNYLATYINLELQVQKVQRQMMPQIQ